MPQTDGAGLRRVLDADVGCVPIATLVWVAVAVLVCCGLSEAPIDLLRVFPQELVESPRAAGPVGKAAALLRHIIEIEGGAHAIGAGAGPDRVVAVNVAVDRKLPLLLLRVRKDWSDLRSTAIEKSPAELANQRLELRQLARSWRQRGGHRDLSMAASAEPSGSIVFVYTRSLQARPDLRSPALELRPIDEVGQDQHPLTLELLDLGAAEHRHDGDGRDGS